MFHYNCPSVNRWRADFFYTLYVLQKMFQYKIQTKDQFRCHFITYRFSRNGPNCNFAHMTLNYKQCFLVKDPICRFQKKVEPTNVYIIRPYPNPGLVVVNTRCIYCQSNDPPPPPPHKKQHFCMIIIYCRTNSGREIFTLPTVNQSINQTLQWHCTYLSQLW